MKNTLIIFTLALILMPLATIAQRSDGFFKGGNDNYENRATINDEGGGISNWGIGETVPLGSGLLILTAVGAGYAVAKRRRKNGLNAIKGFNASKALILTFALILSITSCKKKVVETVTPTPTNGVNITLNVDGNNSKVIVDPTNNGQNDMASVKFEAGDIVYVGYNNNYVGFLTYVVESEENKYFSGTVNITSYDGYSPLHFYFLGGTGIQPDPSTVSDNKLSVVISDQTSKYPVISYNHSKEPYTGGGSYSAKLISKCSIMKFNVTTPSTAAICITGMKNKVTVNFATPTGSDNGFSYSVNSEDGGLIKMPAKDGDNVTWAIVLPQSALSAGAESTAYTADNFYKGSRPAIAAITANQYINAGKALTINTLTQLGTPLTLEAKTAGTIAIANPKSGMKYTLNGGAKTQVPTSITVAAGDIVQLYGNGTSITVYGNDKHSESTMITGGTADCYIYGNIMSLVDETGFGTATTLARLSFGYLFENNTHLVNHPTKLLLLPAENLAHFCYYSIFNGCTGLTSAPELPATVLFESCYAFMFNGCTGLTSAPELPATNLYKDCYYSMFKGCTSLTTAPALPATTLADFCYSAMFYGCTNMTTAPALPATTLANSCYNSMFYGCSNLTAAPALPATTLATGCYTYMFKDCTSLTTSPLLAAETLTKTCYYQMFDGCTNLNSVRCLATDISATYCTKEWLNGVAASGTFYINTSLDPADPTPWTKESIDGIPNGWTIEKVPSYPEGAINGRFTINNNGDQVYF